VSDIDVVGSGNFDECVQNFLNYTLERGECSGECIYNSIVFPRPFGWTFALSAYYYPAEFFHRFDDSQFTVAPKWPEKETLDNLDAFGRKYCSLEWDTLRNEYNPMHNESTDQNLRNYCLQLAYGNTFLRNGLRFNGTTTEVERLNSYNGVSIGWPYGVILARALGEPQVIPKPPNRALQVAIGIISV